MTLPASLVDSLYVGEGRVGLSPVLSPLPLVGGKNEKLAGAIPGEASLSTPGNQEDFFTPGRVFRSPFNGANVARFLT